MTTKKSAKKGKPVSGSSEKSSGSPKFPYTILPAVLKKLLKEIPQRPKPPKMTRETLKVWNVSASGNSDSAIRVLKKIGLLDDSGTPKPEYAQFMDPIKGSAVLGGLLRNTYSALFESSLKPLDSSAEELKTFFNVHSGGGEDAMRLQIQTFKILAEFATVPSEGSEGHDNSGTGSKDSPSSKDGQNMPPVRVDLHIHLPDNKSSREYESIIQDIARYIYGRNIQ